jgi:hypothetical protein
VPQHLVAQAGLEGLFEVLRPQPTRTGRRAPGEGSQSLLGGFSVDLESSSGGHRAEALQSLSFARARWRVLVDHLADHCVCDFRWRLFCQGAAGFLEQALPQVLGDAAARCCTVVPFYFPVSPDRAILPQFATLSVEPTSTSLFGLRLSTPPVTLPPANICPKDQFGQGEKVLPSAGVVVLRYICQRRQQTLGPQLFRSLRDVFFHGDVRIEDF